MKNSIEEAVKTMERWVEYEKNNKDKINKADELIYIQEIILSDYKRVLKENEQLKNDIENMYDEEVVISIIEDNFNLCRNEVLEMLGSEE